MSKSIRILLAVAAWYDYEIWHMDVKTTFLNGFVDEEDPSCHYMTDVSPMHLEMCYAMKSCGHSRCPNRIGCSYIEQLGVTWTQVKSIDAWSRMGTDAQLHALDQGRETIDRRTVPVRTQSLNVHTTIHLVFVPWTVARWPPMVTDSPDQRLIKSY
ncbi:UNVERIFIED_CONTAM: hypothetical protein Slati_3502300 [Sesamum latifolium]|uniref:Reverse transcriptase Ty1/copia-type domain-containing protein n=1 Tax=Sesamum latifolium TaxID=2727402 RepID=A0AAW2UI72_9LAMI